MNLKMFIVAGCIFSACAKPPQHVRCVDEVVKGFYGVVKKEKAMVALGGGGYFRERLVTGVYADFELSRQVASQEEARELLVVTVEELVERVNSYEKLRPFLTKYPLSAADISLSIAFTDEVHKPVSGLAQIHLYEGKIYYSAFDPAKKAYIAFLQENFPDS